MALWFAAASVGEAAAAQGDRPQAAARGEMRPDLLYHNYCSVCHGDLGDGRSRAQGSLVPPPKDFTSPHAIAQLTRDYMIAITASGKPGTAMVGWSTQLSNKEIEAVVDYVIASFMQPRTTPGFARGRALYAENCAVCHGDQGRGAQFGGRLAVPPRDFGSPQARAELGRDRMIASVTHGKPGTPMAGFERQLSAQDIGLVVDFIRVAFMGASPVDASGTSAHHGRGAAGRTPQARAPNFPGVMRPDSSAATTAGNGGSAPGHGPIAAAASAAPAAVQANMSLPFPGSLVGDASRGKRFYDENCATCHGLKGDAQGPRAYFIRPKPRNFLTPESRATYNRPALFAGVSQGRLGSEMPAWSKVIEPQQIADVAEYVFRSFIVAEHRPPPAAQAPAGGANK